MTNITKLQYKFSNLTGSPSFVLKNHTTTLATTSSLASFHISSLTPNKALHPWFITAFADAESCLHIKFIRNKKLKTGWEVGASFEIGLHQKDLELLKLVQSYFKGVGIFIKGKDYIHYQVRGLKDLRVIMDHFDKYPLITQKRADYELFKQAFELISRKEHLTTEGLQRIVAIKASINLGLSEGLKAAFPDVEPVQRPLVLLPESIDPHWLAGFTSGEGCFNVSVLKSSTHKIGFSVSLRFSMSQHSRDAKLMEGLTEYFDCGVYQPHSSRDSGELVVTKYSDITEKIIPFFDTYPIQGVKSLDFADFRKVADIMKLKGHITESGLEQIRIIKAGMNSKREVK